MPDDCRNTSVPPNGTVGSPEIGATSHETGGHRADAPGPDRPIQPSECPPVAGFLADFTFRARVTGRMSGGDRLVVGRDGEGHLWVPFPDGNRPAIGDVVSVRVQVAP